MSFTPEQKEELQSLFDNFGASILDKFGGTMNNALSGAVKRISATLEKQMTDRLSPIEERMQNLPVFDEKQQSALVKTALNQVLEELTSEEANSTQGNAQGNTAPADLNNSPAFLEMKRQMEEQSKQFQQRLQAAEQRAAQEKETREKIAEDQRISSMETGFVNSLRGKIRANTENDMLTLLKTRGLLTEENGQYLVKGKDQYQMDALVPIDQALPELLKGDFSYFADSRPGTGTGNPGTSSGTGVSTGSGGRFFNGGNRQPDAQELMAAMADPSKAADLFRELESMK